MWTLTPWMTEPPVRRGWYAASTERNDTMRAHFNGTRWSVQVDEAASREDRAHARKTPMPAELAGRIEWCGLTRRAAAWLAAEMPTT